MTSQDRLRAALAAGDLVAAERLAQEALVQAADDVVLRARLGSIQMSLGRLDDAVSNLRLAAAAAPESGIILNEFGVALAKYGEQNEAEAALHRALQLSPEVPQIHNNYGNVLRAKGDFAGAIDCYRKALERKPDYWEALGNLGVVLQETGDVAESVKCFERLLQHNPDDDPTWTHLGAALASVGRLSDAEAAHRKAISRNPDSPDAYNNLGIVLKDQGRLDEARQAYQRAVDCDPADSGLHSNLLMCLCYDPKVDAAETIALHQQWANSHAPEAPFDPFSSFEAGPVRVGYLSPDFRDHSVAFFMEALLASHDEKSVEVHCYADIAEADATTERLRSHVGQWHDVYRDSDEALFRRIRNDRIQVLVDLAGHTANNRLPVFARRAAPVQVTWLGYGMTTGLPQMDYLLSDNWVDPPGESDSWCTEEIYRLPSGFMTYSPPTDCPLPPRDPGQPVTFGSFNNLSKMNDEVVALWVRVLAAVPQSRLLLKSRQLADRAVGERLRSAFSAAGIATERLEFVGRTASRADHYALYGQVDVALDTFPYNGATTTCEALWMGTPVVSLVGDRHVGRFGRTFLTRAGFADWVAETSEAYVEIARGLAQTRPSAADIRTTMASSLLVDGKRAARDMEEAFSTMWRGWKEKSDG